MQKRTNVKSKDEEEREYDQQHGSEAVTDYAVCLHCNNPFPVSEGVVTADAAICDVCND
tara:strand:+ start:1624 stop:1800 length:177 start_codon:yes stop_codon:yes gene_type:complete